MSGFFGATFWFVVVLSVLVTFHEFGHYWVARRFGIRVLRFSIGFGKPLWSRVDAAGTRWQVAMIPLGGYVQFLDEREQEVAPAERENAFNRKPPWQRILVVLAGPVANLLLCIALFWIAMQLGRAELAPVLGETRGLAAEAGLRSGDRLLAVGGEPVTSWDNAIIPLALAEIDREPITIKVRDAGGGEREHILRLDKLHEDFDQTNPLVAVGLSTTLTDDAPVVGVVRPDSAAEGKLQPGDRILRIGARPIARYSELRPALQLEAAAGAPVAVELERAGSRMRLSLQPKRTETETGVAWILGVEPRRELVLQRYAPLPALRQALAQTGKQSREMLAFIARLVTGKASSKNLSGVIGIAQVANSEAGNGAPALLWFMASLSLTLCIMNLLPIPVLDGGHLLYYLIELISGRPVGERVLIAGQYAGLLLLAGLIGLAFYNDIVRTIS